MSSKKETVSPDDGGDVPIQNIDFLSFINNLQNASAMSSRKKKSGKAKKVSKCTIKEVDDENAEECECEEEKVDDDNDDSSSDDSEDSDNDDSEEDDDDEDDDDEDDDEGEEYHPGLTEESLWNVLSNFFTDEEGNNIATSMSNIAYELHKINKYLKSK
jgi:hypothetical protein